MSKPRRQTKKQFDETELFSDDDFDADDFIEQMDSGSSQVRAKARTGWRRLEELREEQMLRAALSELSDWDEFDSE